MAREGRIPVWWDRDLDNTGRAIRPDVRSAGKDIWQQACQKTIALVGDDWPAAELMENAVAQVSRYLDRIGAPASAPKHGLVMAAFGRALRRYAAKVSRIDLVGNSEELLRHASSRVWVAQANARLDLEKIMHRPSGRSGEILTLRAVGYEWKEIAALFGTPTSCLRNSFWREIKQIR